MNAYDEARGLFDNESNDLKSFETCLLVTGIANNQDIIEHLESMDKKVEVMKYKDHANYKKGRVKNIVNQFQKLNEHSPTCIITTQKDAVKLQEWKDMLGSLPIFSITYSFVLDPKHEFKRWILPRIMR
jgi:tetraacyldisaccharide-1-P 4'-kinase